MTDSPTNPVSLLALGSDGKFYPVKIDQNTGKLLVDVVLETADIEIGGVEIKNGADDTRAVVTAGASTPGATDNALVVAVADGKDVALGAKADASQPDPTQSASLIALVKGWLTSFGRKTDAANAATDTTSVSAMSVWKQISASIQAAVTALGTNHADEVQLHTDIATTLHADLIAATPAGNALIGKVGIDQTTPGTTDSVSVKSQGYKSAVTVTRPANQTPYTANDALGATAAAITFPSIGPAAGGQVIITSAKLEIDVAAIPSGMTSFRLYLYDVTPPSALADNAAWDLPSGDRASFKGYIDLGSPVDLGSTLYVETNGINKQITVPAGGSLFGYLVTNGGFTPAANSEVYVVTLHSVAV